MLCRFIYPSRTNNVYRLCLVINTKFLRLHKSVQLCLFVRAFNGVSDLILDLFIAVFGGVFFSETHCFLKRRGFLSYAAQPHGRKQVGRARNG